MNNINNRASSLWEKLKSYIAFIVRYIVFIGRKNPIVAYIAIAIYGVFFYQAFLRNTISFQSNRNLPLPSQSSSTYNPVPTYTPTPNPNVANSQLSRQERIEQRLKEQELARIAEEEKQLNQKRIEASKEKLKKGDVFIGELVFVNRGIAEQKQPIKLEVKAIVGKTYIVKFSDPNNERVSQIFEGNLVEKLTTPENSALYIKESPRYASLYLKSRSPQELGGEAWNFYKWDTHIVFAPTELGFDGRVMAKNPNRSDATYNLVLRNEDLNDAPSDENSSNKE